MNLDDLPTPCLILDLDRLDRNLARMRDRAQELGVQLRPHMKTAKSADIARAALGGEAGPITVSTLAEARHFAEAGFTDITYAVGITPGKLEEAAALRQRGVALKLLTDDVAMAARLQADGAARGIRHEVLIEIDCGLGRAGLLPDAPELADLASALAAGETGPGAALAGVLTHAGHSYHATDAEGIAAIAEAERQAAVQAAGRLRALGQRCDIVSVGSTPTALFARDLAGVTEMRPGNYMFFDLFQAGLGTCALTDIAVSVLAAVTGHHAGRNHLLLDAGGLALSKDTGAAEHMPSAGYGLVCLPNGAVPLPDLAVREVHQEHGLVGRVDPGSGDRPLPFHRFPVGARLRVLPNHSCMTAAMYDRYYLVRGGQITGTWSRVNGWSS